MKDFPEISLGAKRNEEGEPLVYVDGVLCGTVENLKRSVDRYWDEEIQRKVAEAGIRFSMIDGVPKISVPASASRMVEVDGMNPVVKLYDYRKDPQFAPAVEAVVVAAKARRAL
ncbi:hypothetical protein [Shinella sp.]|uniref:hypothetical protein n=1 Tax=Shinella sp. TaxID=1870904 RepID=UPI0028B15CFF|nr:hypothetical protein [Shinella sp.]